MTTETSDAVLGRIRKLQKLTASSNQHEAALAAAKMQELLFRHNLSMEALRDPSEYVEEQRHVGRRIWARRLLVSLCRNNFCEPLHSSWGGDLFIVGRRDNVAAVNLMFAYLVGEIDRLARTSYAEYKTNTPWPEPGKTWCLAFRSGAVVSITGRLRDQRERDINKVSTSVVGAETGTAIIRRLDAELSAEVTRRHPHLTAHRGSMSTIRSWSGFKAGQVAGNRMSLTRGRGHLG
ncbi:MAG: hypothetical protein QOK05_113 [Chloroflexota bacterium]|jgi:hypothetical protein|nr:hypothetical protein [Chloroflexota bacterium]